MRVLAVLFFALPMAGCLAETQKVDRDLARHSWNETQWHSCVTTANDGRTACVEGCAEIKVSSDLRKCHDNCVAHSRVGLNFCSGL